MREEKEIVYGKEREACNPAPSKYPQITLILKKAMSHAFDVGVHWTKTQEPRGEFDMDFSFLEEIEEEIGRLFINHKNLVK